MADSELHPAADLLTAVTGAARLYSGLGYQLQAARAWRLVYRVARQLGDSEATVTGETTAPEVSL